MNSIYLTSSQAHVAGLRSISGLHDRVRANASRGRITPALIGIFRADLVLEEIKLARLLDGLDHELHCATSFCPYASWLGQTSGFHDRPRAGTALDGIAPALVRVFRAEEVVEDAQQLSRRFNRSYHELHFLSPPYSSLRLRSKHLALPHITPVGPKAGSASHYVKPRSLLTFRPGSLQ